MVNKSTITVEVPSNLSASHDAAKLKLLANYIDPSYTLNIKQTPTTSDTYNVTIQGETCSIRPSSLICTLKNLVPQKYAPKDSMGAKVDSWLEFSRDLHLFANKSQQQLSAAMSCLEKVLAKQTYLIGESLSIVDLLLALDIQSLADKKKVKSLPPGTKRWLATCLPQSTPASSNRHPVPAVQAGTKRKDYDPSFVPRHVSLDHLGKRPRDTSADSGPVIELSSPD